MRAPVTLSPQHTGLSRFSVADGRVALSQGSLNLHLFFSELHVFQ